MEDIQFVSLDEEKSAFVILKKGKHIAEMVVVIKGKEMTVVHTEISVELQGKGIGKKLFEEMVAFARDNEMQVFAHCSYVKAQFDRDPEKFNSILNRKR